MSPVEASLVDFLRTGRLGRLSTDLTRAGVRDLLGPPDDWDDGPDGKTSAGDSNHWIYGALEISFQTTSPHRIEWFQLDHLNIEAEPFAGLGRRISLSMDGLAWNLPPSVFLSQLDAGNAEIQFELASGHVSLRLFAGDDVEMLFVLSEPLAVLDDVKASKADLAKALQSVEARSLVESIYAFPQPRGRDERLLMRTVRGSSTTWMTGQDYLDLISD